MAAFAGEQGTATSVRLELVLLACLPTRIPEAHLGCLGGSSDRPCISWLTVRGLGTGLGALDFLHQMAKPPMSLEQGGGAGRKPMLCEAGAERVLGTHEIPIPTCRGEVGRGGCCALPHSQVSGHCLGLPTQLHVTHNHVGSPQGHQLHTHAFLPGHRGLWEWGQGSERGEQGREGSTQKCSP